MGEKQTEYVFGSLTEQQDFNKKVSNFAYVADKSLRAVSRTLSNQAKVNKTVFMLACLGMIYIYAHEKRISKLTKKVEELKRTKGE